MIFLEDSIVIRYNKWLRRMWGLAPLKAVTSLCPVCQFIFWMSLVTLIAAVPALLGFVGWKLLTVIEWLINDVLCFQWLCNSWNAGVYTQISRKCEFRYYDRPLPSVLTCFVAMFLYTHLIVLIVAGVLLLCFFGGTWVWEHLLQIPSLVWSGILRVGTWGFYVLYFVGYIAGVVGGALVAAAVSTWNGLVWFFTNQELLWEIAHTAFVTALASAVALVLFFAVRRFAESRAAVAATDWFGKQGKKIRHCPKPNNECCNREPKIYRGPGWWSRLFSRIGGAKVVVGNTVETALTPLTALWEFLKAVKKGVCPIVEIYSREQLNIIQNPKLVWVECNDDERLRMMAWKAKVPYKPVTMYDDWFYIHSNGKSLFRGEGNRLDGLLLHDDFDNPRVAAELYYADRLKRAEKYAQQELERKIKQGLQ